MVIGRLIYFVLAVIIFFIVFRLIFLFLGIVDGNAFVSLVMNWGGFFAGPFFGILPSIHLPPPLGIIETSTAVALVVYIIIAQLLFSLFKN
ncbi:MAG: hypothetical protein M1150_02360 [Patescibacteria group bacterium]|nr:hypothetical protein [Patescibacteria group bacterium]